MRIDHDSLCPAQLWTDHVHNGTGDLLSCPECARYNMRMCTCSIIAEVREAIARKIQEDLHVHRASGVVWDVEDWNCCIRIALGMDPHADGPEE